MALVSNTDEYIYSLTVNPRADIQLTFRRAVRAEIKH